MPSLIDRMRAIRRRPRPVAFVLGGGGNLGAVQIGMLRALVERGVLPDLVVGCSVGALNGAAFCCDPTEAGVARLEEVWRNIDGKDLMPSGWVPTAMQLARRGASVLDSNDALRRVFDRAVVAERFEDLAIPFQCVATSLLEAREVWFAAGELRDSVLASSAIPAIYPPVEIAGVRYIDGAVVNDIPISRAVELGARRLYVLHVGSYDRPRPEPRRPIDLAVQAYWIARRHRFHRDLSSMPKGVEVIVLPVGEWHAPAFNDFSRTDALMSAAYDASGAHLDAIADERLATHR